MADSRTSEYMTRTQASEFVSHSIGLPIAPQTLAKMAVDGTGPRYFKAGRRALYRPDDLLRWASEKITVPNRRKCVGGGEV